MINSRIFDFKWSNKNKLDNLKELLAYSSISTGLMVLIVIFISLYVISQVLFNIFSYSLALAAPVITVTLIHLKESYNALNYEKKLRSALIDEIISNLHSIKSNENILKNEFKDLKKGAMSTDPLVKMVWDRWEIVKFHYASKNPNFDLNIIYNYIRGLYVINEAINERRLYTIIHVSSRTEYNKLILKLNSQSIDEIKTALETLNAKMFIFKDKVTFDEVFNVLNSEKIPTPVTIVDLFEKPLDEFIIIVNKN